MSSASNDSNLPHKDDFHFQEPESSSRPSRKYRQVSRLLKHLREELAARHPRLNLPTSWMIDNLVLNCPPVLFSGDNWHIILQKVLSYLSLQTDATHFATCRLCQSDGSPLFPNDELFDEQDTYCFCSYLLEYLDADLN